MYLTDGLQSLIKLNGRGYPDFAFAESFAYQNSDNLISLRDVKQTIERVTWFPIS